MHRFLQTLVLLASVCLAMPAFAADTATPVADKPQPAVARSTPVAVDFEGNDTIGSRLSTRIKESLNSSNLFALSEKDTPKIRIMLTTVPEFQDRPGVGSAYAVIWLFSQSENTLRHFLMREVGVVTPEQVNELAARIVERTDGLAVRYGYLFQ